MVVCNVAAIVSITLIVVVALLAATGFVSVSIRSRRISPQSQASNASARHAVDEYGSNADSGSMQYPSKASSPTCELGAAWHPATRTAQLPP
ncbi:hypothetical protein MRX96_053336 [Rhipicephalus microplus]